MLTKLPARSYDEVFEFYKIQYNRLSDKYKEVLKTDSYDEFIGRPLARPEHFLLELNKDFIPKGWNVVQGDIRDIPFPDNTFDLVADFSTIDHIPWEDVDIAFKEYRRVATKAYVICWTHFEYWQSHDQFEQNFFPRNEMLAKLENPHRIFTDTSHFLQPELWGGYVGLP